MSGPAVSSADDPNTGYLLQAACRIAQCMGQAFASYLPRLLPLVMSLAELDPKLQMDAHDGDDAGDEEAAVVQIKGLGKMRVCAEFPFPPANLTVGQRAVMTAGKRGCSLSCSDWLL